MDVRSGGQFDSTVKEATIGIIRFLARQQIRYAGKALEAVNPSSGLSTFDVDTTRQTVHIRELAALPTTTSRVGKLCVVGGALYNCTAAGTPGTWVKVGTQA